MVSLVAVIRSSHPVQILLLLGWNQTPDSQRCSSSVFTVSHRSTGGMSAVILKSWWGSTCPSQSRSGRYVAAPFSCLMQTRESWFHHLPPEDACCPAASQPSLRCIWSEFTDDAVLSSQRRYPLTPFLFRALNKRHSMFLFVFSHLMSARSSHLYS